MLWKSACRQFDSAPGHHFTSVATGNRATLFYCTVVARSAAHTHLKSFGFTTGVKKQLLLTEFLFLTYLKLKSEVELMFRRILFATAVLVSSAAHSQTFTTICNTTFGSNGTTYQQIGNTTFGSNGTTYQQIGNTTFGSNGNTYQQIGNTTFGSNGTTSQQIGNTTFINGPNGMSRTCQQIGAQTFCN